MEKSTVAPDLGFSEIWNFRIGMFRILDSSVVASVLGAYSSVFI